MMKYKRFLICLLIIWFLLGIKSVSLEFYNNFKNNSDIKLDKRVYNIDELLCDSEYVGDDFYTLGTIENHDYIMMNIYEDKGYFDALKKRVYTNCQRHVRK